MIIIEKTWIDKLLKISLGLIVAFAIFSQIYSLIQIKAFWLDEWFILYNIKHLSYSKIFGNLFYIQQFPRVYLIIIKAIADFSDYNYLCLRLIPTSIQILNIILIVFLVRKIIFPNSAYKGGLFVLFFLSFQPTIFYFSQLKQYTMDMFFALISVCCYHYLSKYYDKLSIKSPEFLFILLGIFAGPFFSYTFPIVFSPILFFFFITCIYDFIEKRPLLKSIFPIFVFLFSLGINYFTDLQFLLYSKEQYGNFEEYIMNYSSISSITEKTYNIVRLFAYNFIYAPQNYYFPVSIFMHLVRIMIILFTFIGLITIIIEQVIQVRAFKLKYLKSFSFHEMPYISVYFLLLFAVTILLFFLKMLPVGQPRLNYYIFPVITYCLITGIFWVTDRFKKIKLLTFIIVIFSTLFPLMRGYIHEINNTNLLFDQKIYENVGNAIIKAQHEKLPILVLNNEFYPMSIIKDQEELLIKSHHLFKPNRPVIVYVVTSYNKEDLHNKLHLTQYIKLNKYDFTIQSVK